MRIIAGRFKRRALKGPSGQDVRPTTDRVRESLFNLLVARTSLHGARVLDLFAGTGALGLEALSRGAASVLFVEAQPKTLSLARTNARTLDIASACTFLKGDAVAVLGQTPRLQYDVIFADPPYELEALPDLPDLALPHLAPDGLFVLEHDVRHAFSEHPALDTTRAYGRTILSLFAHPDGEDAQG